MSEKEEGTLFNLFVHSFGDPVSTEARKRREKRAGMSEKQRNRKAVRTEQVNFRASPAIAEVARKLAAKLDCSVADVMEKALTAFAEAHKVKVPKQ